MITKIDTEALHLSGAERDQRHRELERDAAWRTVVRHADDFNLLIETLGLNDQDERRYR